MEANLLLKNGLDYTSQQEDERDRAMSFVKSLDKGREMGRSNHSGLKFSHEIEKVCPNSLVYARQLCFNAARVWKAKSKEDKIVAEVIIGWDWMGENNKLANGSSFVTINSLSACVESENKMKFP